MLLCRGSNILRKQLEMRLIFQLGTMQLDSLNINFKCLNYARTTFYAYALPFNVVTNILRTLTVIFHTEEGLYTGSVRVNKQFRHFVIIISLITNLIFYFQVPHITKDFSVSLSLLLVIF